VIVADEAMLLAQIAEGYPRAGRWTLPGGGLDWGEAPDAAVHRELYEEAGLRGEIESLLGIDSIRIERRRNGRVIGYHALRVIYQMTVTGEPRVMETNGSVADSRWIPLADVPELPTVELVESALRMLAAGS
jgi:8-oxo-dGTP diphosphatase